MDELTVEQLYEILGELIDEGKGDYELYCGDYGTPLVYAADAVDDAEKSVML